MKKQFITALILIFSLLAGTCVYAAETLDIPQNTNLEDAVINDKNTENEKDVSAKPDTKQDKQTLTQDKSDKDTKAEEKPEKTKKFFSRAEKEKQSGKETDAAQDGPATEVLVDSDSIEYFPERHEFEAVGNAKVSFPEENSTLLADRIIFNHDTNFIKGYGNVVLIKEGQRVNGDYIQVDLYEDNAMMTHPVLDHLAIKIRAKNAQVSDV